MLFKKKSQKKNPQPNRKYNTVLSKIYQFLVGFRNH